MFLTKITEPTTPSQWQAYYDLRWRILRKPWNEPKGSEQDKDEARAIHRALYLDTQLLAIGRLHKLDDHNAQIRYMAVESKHTGKGYGSQILKSLEDAALDMGVTEIILNARDTARQFYEKHGYEVIDSAHTLFNAIPHFRMNKHI